MIACANGDRGIGSYGLAIYLPSAPTREFSFSAAYTAVPFAQDTNWDGFLVSFTRSVA